MQKRSETIVAMNQKISIVFGGDLANRHEMDMRHLRASLIGMHRLTTVGLFILETGKYPKRNQALPYSINAA